MTKREKILVWVLVGLIVLAGGYLAYLFCYKPNNTVTKTTNDESKAVQDTVKMTETQTSKITPIVDAGVTWLSEPQSLDNLKLFKGNCYTDSNFHISYYKIADMADGSQMIMAKAPSCELGPINFFRFKKDANGKYILLAKSTSYDPYEGNYFSDIISDSVTIDNNTIYAQLSSPAVIQDASSTQYKKGLYAPFMGSDILFSELINPVEVGETVYGKVYQAFDQDSKSTEAKIRYIYLKHADGTATPYGMSIPFMSDDSVPSVTINGVKNTDKYYSSIVVGGCGGLGSVSVVTNIKDITSRIKEVGTASNNDKIYQPTSVSDPIYALAYESYKVGRENNALSLADFVAKTPVFLWKDQLGNYVAFLNQNYAPNAECGKPVVYLYPTKTTSVTVALDVDVTVSDPVYNGIWKAIAEPSGNLTVDGKKYPYLYWEGKGKAYPQGLDRIGSIVKSSEVKSRIISDLKSLGLNDKETADFLEFWLPKMPQTPYTRLTWLGTGEMNALAPMTITPKPDTVIRVFLDFAGVNTPYDIAAQKLTALERKGFTVVEWGGLLVK